MRPLATNRPRLTISILAGLVCLAALAPAGCKRPASKQQAGADGDARSNAETVPAETIPDETPSVFDEPDPFAMPDHREVVGMDWDIPEGWEAYDDLRSFRLATWRVDGENEGIFAFAFYMGRSMQGTVESNANRWSLQVRNADESHPDPVISARAVGPLTVTTIRFNGNYVAGMTQSELELGAQGGSLIGVVIEGGPVGNIFFRISGPKFRIDELLPAFDRMLDSIRIIEGFQAP